MKETISDRLKSIRGDLSQQKFADLLGVNRTIIADLERGKTKKPSAQLLEALRRNFHINPQWLLTGVESQDETNEDNFYKIDRLSIKASAGSGILNHEVTKENTILIPKLFFKTPQNQNNLKAIQVEGDSMEPTILDGSYIIIDTSKNSPIDGIYAILLYDEILVKRLQFNLNGSIELISDNPAYKTKVFNPKEQTDIDFKILGKKILTIQ
jgi:phage repressor protein C with HTH and peptisase S24 domain